MENKMFVLLETFIEVYNTKSYTEASKILFVTQSTVSKRIRKLEEELSITLFKKTPFHKVEASEAAEDFYSVALSLLHDLENFKLNFSEKSSKKTSFKIGISPEASHFFMPKIFQVLSPILDSLDLKVNVYSNSQIFDFVKSGQLNLGLTEEAGLYLHEEDVIQYASLFEEPLVLAGNIKSGNLFCQESRGGLASESRRFRRENRHMFKNYISVNDINMIMQHLRLEIGAAIVPRNLVPSSIPFRNLELHYKHTYGMIYFKDLPQKREFKLIQKIIKELKDLQ